MAGLTALVLANWGSAAYPLPFGDSDTLTRIAYLDSAGWKGILDPLYPRDGAPDGMLLEWTLPFNALALLQGQALGWPMAGILSGPLGLLLLMGSAWSASRQLGRAAPYAIACMLSFASVILAYAQPGRVNHHDVTAALCIACIAAALRWWRRPGCLSAAMAGGAGALALWQSMETVPMVLAGWSICLVAAVFWPRRMARLGSCSRLPGTCWYGIGAVCVLVPALALDGPWPRFPLFTLHRLSLCHLVIMSAISLGLMMAHAYALASSENKRSLQASAGMRGMMALGAGSIPLLAASGALLLLKPDTVHGPLFDSYFWSPIGELGNILTNPFTVLLALAIPLFTASTWAVFCCGRRPGCIMRWNLLAILCGCMVMGCIYVRLIVHAESMSLVLGSLMLSAWLRRWKWSDAPAWFAIGCALMHAPALIPMDGPAVAACRASPQWGAWLEAALPEGATVLADIWPTPSILASTVRIRAVGGPYHGNPGGIEDVARFMTGSSEHAAQDILVHRNIVAVVLCADPLYAPGAPWPDGSMARRMVSGGVPSWLVPMAGAPPSGLRAWRVALPATR